MVHGAAPIIYLATAGLPFLRAYLEQGFVLGSHPFGSGEAENLWCIMATIVSMKLRSEYQQVER